MPDPDAEKMFGCPVENQAAAVGLPIVRPHFLHYWCEPVHEQVNHGWSDIWTDCVWTGSGVWTDWSTISLMVYIFFFGKASNDDKEFHYGLRPPTRVSATAE